MKDESDLYPITVYFDASCSLCNSEIQNIVLQDSLNRLICIDCSAADFDDTPFRAQGFTQKVLMDHMHVIDQHGQWHKGAAAFELIYRSINLNVIANLWGSRLSRPLAEKIYPWVARNRYLLSKTGLPFVFNFWGKFIAHQAHKRSRQCHNGRCGI